MVATLLHSLAMKCHHMRGIYRKVVPISIRRKHNNRKEELPLRLMTDLFQECL